MRRFPAKNIELDRHVLHCMDVEERICVTYPAVRDYCYRRWIKADDLRASLFWLTMMDRAQGRIDRAMGRK